MRHRWGDKIRFPLAHKSEQTCCQCGITKVSRHESEGGRDTHWAEFWCGEERIHCEGTPVCVDAGEAATYSARSYPL